MQETVEPMGAGQTGAGWYPDSTQPGRERWWNGEHWTARVVTDGAEHISWAVTIVEQPPPVVVSVVDGETVIDLTGVGELTDDAPDAEHGQDDPTESIVVLYGGAPGVATPTRFLAPAPQSFAPIVRMRPVLRSATPPAAPEPRVEIAKPRAPRRARRVIAAAVAALLVLAAAAAGVLIFDSRTSSSTPLPTHAPAPHSSAAWTSDAEQPAP